MPPQLSRYWVLIINVFSSLDTGSSLNIITKVAFAFSTSCLHTYYLYIFRNPGADTRPSGRIRRCLRADQSVCTPYAEDSGDILVFRSPAKLVN